MARRLVSALFVSLLAVSLGGCSNTDVVPVDRQRPATDIDDELPDPVDTPTWRLEAFEAGPVLVVAGESVDVGFLLTINDVAAPDELVSFELDGTGASLGGDSDLTRENGLAAATLDAGWTPSELVVIARHPLGGEARTTVQVTPPDELPATLRVGVLYGAQDRWPVDRVDVAVHSGTDCAALAGGAPAPLAERELLDLASSLLFTRLAAGQSIAVHATGSDATGVIATGCSDGILLEEGKESGTVVRLVPGDLDPSGTWDVTQSYDFGDTLPGDLGGVFRTLDQMFDDPDDPARFLVEWVEAELGFSFGPLQGVVIGLIDDLVSSVLPAGVQGLFQNIGEAARLVTRFTVDTTIDLSWAAADELVADEVWNQIVFEWDGGTRTVHWDDVVLDPVTAQYDVEFTDDGRLLAPRHELELPYVGLYRVVLTNIVYPDLGGGATTTGELLESYIDCANVASEMEASDGTADGKLDIGLGSIDVTALEGACLSAVNWIANRVDAEIDGLAGDGPQILVRDGVSRLTGEDAERHPLNLEDGVWAAELHLDGQTKIVNGVYSGARR